jgi:hypothetical protein
MPGFSSVLNVAVVVGLSAVAVAYPFSPEDLFPSLKTVKKSALPNLILYRTTTSTAYCRMNLTAPISDSVVHKRVFERSDGSLFVQHIDIIQNGARCGKEPDDHLNIYPSTSFANASNAAAAGISDVYKALRSESWAALTFDRITANNKA